MDSDAVAGIPKLGLGTWLLNGDECRESVRDALSMGYRHIDTATSYENEEQVGDGIRGSGVPRDRIFLTTKLGVDAAGPEVRAHLEASLRRLRTDYVDLLLIHWPNLDDSSIATVEAMAGVRDDTSMVRSIGVSNFTTPLVEEATPYGIVANQVEYHPYLSQEAIIETAHDHDQAVVAYAPLARGRVVDDPVLNEIGSGHGKTAAQVALRWCLQQPGVCVIPKSAGHRRRIENLDIFDFELTGDEMAAIHDLADGYRIVDPPRGPDWSVDER